jgi:hypothetical protein
VLARLPKIANADAWTWVRARQHHGLIADALGATECVGSISYAGLVEYASAQVNPAGV